MITDLLLILVSSATASAVCSEEFNRAGRGAMIECLSKQLDGSNEDLRIAWVGALERAKSDDREKKQSNADIYASEHSSEGALTRAQKGWNAYRNEHCRVQELSMWPGNGGGSLYLSCMIELGEQRESALVRYSRNGQF